MKCVVVTLLISLFVSPARGAYGPCANKFLAPNDQSQGTADFNIYIEILIKKRIVSQKDLRPFLAALEEGKLINPIPHQNNQVFAFHYQEFQDLIKTSPIDIKSVQRFMKEVFKKSDQVAREQKKTSKDSEGVSHMTAPGAVFYKRTHPKLGEVYQILKPGKKVSDKSAFDAVAWVIQPISGTIKYAQAVKACVELGGRLPTDEEYKRLMGYFYPYDTKDDKLTKQGLKEFNRLFGSRGLNRYWASEVKSQLIQSMPNWGWMFGGETGFLVYIEGSNELGVRCVTTWSP